MPLWFHSFLPRAYPVVALIVGYSLAGCQCGSKTSRSPGGPTQASQPAPQPPAPVPAPGPTVDPSVGEAVPPIQPDKVSMVDTSNGGGLRHLIFKATDKTEFGRHLTEYFMVIKASKPSCIRIKMRPTASVADKVADEIAQSGEQGAGPCQGTSVVGEQVAPPAPPAPSPTPAPGPASPLNLVSSSAPTMDNDGMTWSSSTQGYDFVNPISSRSFQLTTSSLAECAYRLFRMETSPGQSDVNIEKVVTKTGRLVSIGSKVRVWIDEEFSNICARGGNLDNENKIPFGPLIEDKITYGVTPVTDFADKIWKAHVVNLTSEMDQMVTRMTNALGGISDVDQSGYVEIFLTPEINRTKLTGFDNHAVDNFRASYVFKPQDLAYYNAEKNPTSNEGEVLYLWVPDPAGIFSPREFPSSNSLSTNYAKGYLATQLSGLIYLNEKILKQKQKSVSDPWLIYSLGLASSMYYAGIDYSTFYFAQYLTSRSQYIPLSNDLNKDFFSADYLPFALDEQMGMRGLFGWYLHNALCGIDALTPCDAMRRFYSSSKTGTALVEEILGTTYDAAVKNFGLSLAIGMADKRDEILKLWEGNTDGLPPKPYGFKDLAEIFPSEPPKTEEQNNKADLRTVDKEDRTVAGAYPSRKMPFAQPLAPDYDLEFKLVPDSIAVVQPMGFISDTTDAAAILGDGLNVVFVPIGERDSSIRTVHYEKLSERAPGDVRPVNLANKSTPFTTFSGTPFYQADVASPNPNQFTVTKNREVWSFGSIDNFYINKEGTKTKIGDTDSISMEFQPCSGISDATELSACQSKTHKALVQLVIRDLDQELAPMLLVTTSDRKIFRGHSILDQVKDVDTQFTDQEGQVSVLCQASHTINSLEDEVTNPNGDKMVLEVTNYDPANSQMTTSVDHDLATNDLVYFTASDGNTPPGISPYFTYKVTKVNNSKVSIEKPDGSPLNFLIPTNTSAKQFMHRAGGTTTCANGGIKGAPFFSDLHSNSDNMVQSPVTHGYKHNYVNYLMQGVLGYPFSTRRTVTYPDPPECPGDFCYLAYEADRQFLKMALVKSKKPVNYVYYPANVNYDKSLPFQLLDEETINDAASLKATMDDPGCTNFGETTTNICMSLSGLDEIKCKNACANANKHTEVNNAIVASFSEKGYFGICSAGPTCQALASLMAEGYPPSLANTGRRTSRWLKPERFLMYHGEASTPKTGMTTHYIPVEPESSDSYCLGTPDITGPQPKLQRCSIKARSVKEVSDLREQLQVSTDRLSSNCFSRKLDTEVDVCVDKISYTREMLPDESYALDWKGIELTTDRKRIRSSSITSRAGEILAKPERIHAVVVEVPGTGTVVNILVGGRKQTQGKYLIRSRLVDWID